MAIDAVEAPTPQALCAAYRKSWPVDAENCELAYQAAPNVAVLAMGPDLYTTHQVVHHGRGGWRAAPGGELAYLDHGGGHDAASFVSSSVVDTRLGPVWRIDTDVERFNPEADEHSKEASSFATLCWLVDEESNLACRTVVTRAEGAWYEGPADDAGEAPSVQSSWSFTGDVSVTADGAVTYSRTSADWHRLGPVDNWLKQACDQYELREPTEGPRQGL